MRHHFLFIFTNCSLVAINHYRLVRHFLVKFLKLYKLACNQANRYFLPVVLIIYIFFMVSLIICDSYLLPCILPIDDKAFKHRKCLFLFFYIHFYVSRTSDSVWLIIIWWMSEWIMNESRLFSAQCLCSYCPCVWDILALNSFRVDYLPQMLLLLTALFERNLFCIAMVMNYFHMALAPLCFVL